MKGIQGLILALGLGIAGAMFNWAYLNSKAENLEMDDFVGIAPDATVEKGEKLTEKQITKVSIPRNLVGKLPQYAVPYSARQTVIGRNIWRTLVGGSLLLQDDYRTPPQELSLGQSTEPGVEERAMWVPVDARTFVASLVVPGDMVSFIVPKYAGTAPTPAPAEPGPDGKPLPKPVPTASGPSTEIIGPFKILSIGNRLGSTEVLRTAKMPQLQENVMTVSVKVINGELEPRAQRLYLTLSTSGQQVGVLLHPRQAK